MKYNNGVFIVGDREEIPFPIENGDEFSLELTDDGILLRPYEVLEVDLGELGDDEVRELLSKCGNKSLSEVVKDTILGMLDKEAEN